MRTRILPALAGAVLATALASPAFAGSYAAMDEAPAKGGELRLASPVTISTDGGPAELIRFPLEGMAVSIDVSGPLAEYTVTQTFNNPLDQPIEAVYVFPLGDDAAVSSYEIVIGERVVKGKIKGREAARRIYDEAKSSGHTAGLLEQQKANVFTQRIANIPPKEKVAVKFRYVEMLDHEDGRYSLVFPMVVGPRYLPESGRGRHPVGAHPAGAAGGPGTSVPYHPSYQGPPVSLTARIDAGVPISGLRSPSHAIKTSRIDDTAVRVQLDGSSGVANRDFILSYKSAGPRTTVGLMTHRNGKSGYFVLEVEPKEKYHTGDITPREVIFLIDHSGSMDGTPLEAARVVSKAMLGTLRPADTFNVITFASGTQRMSSRPVRADAAGKARGLGFIDSITADGGTEMERGVLESLARKPGGDRIRMVYIMSDGFVGNDDVILSAAQKHLGHNRMFPVGIGSAPNRYLLDRLGEVGRGFTRYVISAQDAGDVATELVRKTAYPYMTNVSIDWGGLDVKEVTPERIPDVYAGMPLVVSGRYEKPGRRTVKVRATVAGRRVEIPLEVEFPETHRQRPVAYVWARQRIHELMATDFGDIDESTKREVTRLGLGFGLVTEFTSYVAVDRSRVVNPSGKVQTLVQPAPIPEGVNFASAVGAGAGASPPAPTGAPATAYSGSYSGGHSVSGGGGGGFGGGGDIDPLTLAMALLLLPAAVLLRRRRRLA